MSPEGRLVVIAANRLGLWARADATPFGHGRPYNRGQLVRLLSDAMFEPLATARALYLPPISWAARIAMPWERAGETLWPAFGGLLMMEAVKRFYAHTSPRGRKIVPARVKSAQARRLSHWTVAAPCRPGACEPSRLQTMTIRLFAGAA
jgi:hypothetical protein